MLRLEHHERKAQTHGTHENYNHIVENKVSAGEVCRLEKGKPSISSDCAQNGAVEPEDRI